jgi:hypothetical protein
LADRAGKEKVSTDFTDVEVAWERDSFTEKVRKTPTDSFSEIRV